MNYAGSPMFRPGKRFGVFPSFGVGWVVSEEGFMQNVKWIDYLKVRGQAGAIGYGTFGAQDLYEDNYAKSTGIKFGPYTTNYQWLGSTNANQSYMNTISRLGNPDLTWEKRKEFTVGIDAALLRNRLSVEVNYFNYAPRRDHHQDERHCRDSTAWTASAPTRITTTSVTGAGRRRSTGPTGSAM
ncbi:MAG: hypothetical protein V8Q54_04550 [Alistipes senegalensis]